jgi:hypothetical protein
MLCTISSTGFSVDIARRLSFLYLTFFVLNIWASFAHAGESSDFRSLLLKQVGTACHDRVNEMKELTYLDSKPAAKFLSILFNGGSDPHFFETLDSFSSDLLVRLTLFFEQDIGVRCPLSPPLVKLIEAFKKAYLRKLNVSDLESPESVDVYFRGLVLSQAEAGPMSVKMKSLTAPQPALERLGGAYDSHVEKQGIVLIVSPNKELAAKFRQSIDEICEGKAHCAFWDDRIVERVMIVDPPGIASFLPELGVLVLSKSLWDEPRLLHQIVLLHELTHVAERLAQVQNNEEWRSQFRKFSGWSPDSSGKWTVRAHPIHAQWPDDLNKTSASDSAFPLKPDEVVVGEKSFDGFVMEKTYREALKRGDISEDIADHVAVFRYAPERFCWNKKPLAPGKYEWIGKKLFFSKAAKPSCM